MISIIIPTLNEEKFLPKLLDSLVAQTDKDFEVIVVDGSSKDKTVTVAKSFARKLPRLRVVVSKSAGLPLQRNMGAKEATGKWLLFLDADDILFPYSLQRCLDYISASKSSFFTTWFSPDSNVSGDANLVLVSNLFIEAAKLVKRQLAPGPFVAVTREAFDLVGGYDENRAYGEDVDFSMRLYEHGILLTILRETIYVYSLRRFRKHGTLTMLQLYAKGSMIALLTGRSPQKMPGYVMGGHYYEKPRNVKKSVLKKYELKLKKLIQGLLNTRILQ